MEGCLWKSIGVSSRVYFLVVASLVIQLELARVDLELQLLQRLDQLLRFKQLNLFEQHSFKVRLAFL